jgi:hypothetical protein
MKKKKKKVKKIKPVLTIGRTETIDFPALQLYGITAKIDTGAYTTALHCHNISIKKIDNKDTLCFYLLDPSHPDYHEQELVFEKYEERDIKNSFGDLERRYVIKTPIRLCNRTIRATISLTNRGNMKFPVLIGRRLLVKKFIVDVSKKNICSNNGQII